MQEKLRAYLMQEGATLVGFGSVAEGLEEDLCSLGLAVCIAVHRRMNEDTVDILGDLQRKTTRWLKAHGHRYLALPPDSDRVTGTFISKLYGLFSHKVAATCSGLGWVGKNGLLINPSYGPRLCMATVLTDAPFKADQPVTESGCGQCNLCVEHCPAGAITGQQWSRTSPFPVQVDAERCRSLQQGTKHGLQHKPPCGLCVNICPFGRKGLEHHSASDSDVLCPNKEDDKCLNIK